MAFNISYIYKAVDKFTPVAQKIKRNVQGITAKVKESTKSVEVMGMSLGNMGRKAILVATVAIGFGIRYLARYETALLGVAKTANIDVGKALDSMGAKFRKVSNEIPISTIELLGMGQAAAQMGVTGQENILNFATVMGKLTRTTNIMGEDGASQLARLINITKGNIAEVENYGSVLVALGNTSAATEGEILQFSTELAGAGALYGVTATQAMGLATAMRVLGIQSEVGSSVVGRALGTVNKAVRKGGRELQFISQMTGIAKDKLKEAFNKNAVDVIAKMGAGLENLESKGGDVAGALAFLGLEGIRDIRVLGSLAKNTALVTEKMDMASKSFKENTALQREFDIQSKSLSNRWQVFKNVIGETALIIGNALMPFLKGTLNILIDIAKSINDIIRNPSWKDLLRLTPQGMLYTAASSLFGGEKTSGINTGNVTGAKLDGKILVEATGGSKVVGTSSKMSGAKGNLGINMNNLSGAM